MKTRGDGRRAEFLEGEERAGPHSMACSGTSSPVGMGSPDPEQVSAPTCGCAPTPPNLRSDDGLGL